MSAHGQAPCGQRDYCSRHPFCGCGAPDPLPERDPSQAAGQPGLFRKFDVRRVDGSDKPGGKHEGCEYFVLDVQHDLHARAALSAYAARARATHPNLAADLITRYDLPVPILMSDDEVGPDIVSEVLAEVGRATVKFPTWPTDPLHALAVLGEEFGELTKAMLQFTYEPHKTNRDEIRAEAMQTAAMALRLAISLDTYAYAPCEQHTQGRKP